VPRRFPHARSNAVPSVPNPASPVPISLTTTLFMHARNTPAQVAGRAGPVQIAEHPEPLGDLVRAGGEQVGLPVASICRR
jgi:hypothetical protein